MQRFRFNISYYISDRPVSFVKCKGLTLVIFIFGVVGCTRLFGWDIHAPGILSEDFARTVTPVSERVALYLPPHLMKFKSKDRGGTLADPQSYHVGEVFAPMLLEGFQSAFKEFVLLEVEPTPEILRRYQIPYLVSIRIKNFTNRLTLKGQTLTLLTETVVMDSNLKVLSRFESKGMSDAKAVFRKKGGPQVNLNAALEHNVLATVQALQDSIHHEAWEKN